MRLVTPRAGIAVLATISTTTNASTVFAFEKVGSDVVMTSSGTLDTRNLSLEQSQINVNDSFASSRLNVGTWTVADALTDQPTTNQLGRIPEPGTLAPVGIGLLGVGAAQRRKAD